jgi:small subunit ribosomal protein S17
MSAEATQESAEMKTGKTSVGIVVSDKMDKTRVVSVQRMMKHPLYKKYIRRDKKLYVHDENNECGAGDRVEVAEVSRPLSKKKRYTLVRIIERAK